MKRIFIISSICLSLFSCKNNNSEDFQEQNYDTLIEYYSDGKLSHKGLLVNGKKFGKHVWYKEKSGEIKTEINYRNDVLDGKRVDYYDKINQIELISYYSRGELVDTSFFFNETGDLEALFLFNGIWRTKIFINKNGVISEKRELVKPFNLNSYTINTEMFFDNNGDTLYNKSRFYRIYKSKDNKLTLKYFGGKSKNYSLILGNIAEDFSYNSNLVDTLSFQGEINIPEIYNKDSFNAIILEKQEIFDSLHGEGVSYNFIYVKYPKLERD